MRSMLAGSGALVLILLVPGCESANTVDTTWGLNSESIEAQVDGTGNLTEVEYHIAPDRVPLPVRDAMTRLHPGGTFVGAEYEVNDGVAFYELTTRVDGRDVEAMFLPDGSLHMEEIEVARDSVPRAVLDNVERAWPGSMLKAVEEIRNHARQLVEYHVKIETGGMKYKVMVDRNGDILRAVRETPAEIEIPVPLRQR